MSLHRNPPFRAEHLGSLLRTPELLHVKTAYEKGQATKADLEAVEKNDIKAVVELQKKLRYSAISDGEYCRHMFWGSFFPGLEGFDEISDPDPEVFRTYAPDVSAFLEAGHKPGESVFCTGKIKHVGSTYVDQFKYLASLVAPEEVKNLKLTLAAPNWYHLRYREGYAYPKDVYPRGPPDRFERRISGFRILYGR